MSPFSSIKQKYKLRSYTVDFRKQLVKPRIDRLLNTVKHCSEPQNYAGELQEVTKFSAKISCVSKPTFTMEEAAENLYLRPLDVNPYMCLECGFIHFGHENIKLAYIRKMVYQNITV